MMNSDGIIFCFLLPLITGVLLLLLSSLHLIRRYLSGISFLGQLFLALAWMYFCKDGHIFANGIGNWLPPFGIVLVIDPLSALMLSLSGLIGFSTWVYGCFESNPQNEHPLRQPLLQFLIVGVNLSFITGDLFNLFVAFEIMLVASYALLTLEPTGKKLKFALPYFILNLMGSALFLIAAGFAYGIFGTLNIADIAQKCQNLENSGQIQLLGALLIIVFGLKAGLFPLYYWLPKSYPILPTPVAAFYAGMLTKVGVYTLLRVFGTMLPHELWSLHQLLAWIASVTMIFGVLGAISQNSIRGILSWHILSQIGYMVLAIGLFTPLSIAACIFYIAHHIIVKSTLFFVGGIAALKHGGDDDLNHMGGLFKSERILTFVFFVQALSLAGAPPFSGFFGKYLIFFEAIKLQEWFFVAATLIAGILTLFSMLKIWNTAFWSPSPDLPPPSFSPRFSGLISLVFILSLISLWIGLGANTVLEYALTAAQSLLNPSDYIQTVFSIEGKGGIK